MIPGSTSNHPSFFRSFYYALKGLVNVFHSERMIWIMCALGFLACLAAYFVGFDAMSWAVLILCCGCVLSAELLNTAIETVVDLASPEYHPLAARAKDIAAAAVWVLCLFVACVGVLLFVHTLCN